VHGDLRGPHQFGGRHPGRGPLDDADARADRDAGVVVLVDGLRQVGQRRGDAFADVVAAARAGEQDGEAVAADPCDHCGIGESGPQRGGDPLEDAVAAMWSTPS